MDGKLWSGKVEIRQISHNTYKTGQMLSSLYNMNSLHTLRNGSEDMLAEYGQIYSHRYISKVRCELQEEDDDFTYNCQIYSVVLCKETIQWKKT